MDVENLKIKADKRLPHHYIIGIEMTNLRSKNPGELKLKYGPVYFHHDQIKALRDSLIRMEDKLYRQTKREALIAEGVYDIVTSISSMYISCDANDCTMHHFSSECKLTEEDFVTFIRSANFSKYTRKQLDDSKI